MAGLMTSDEVAQFADFSNGGTMTRSVVGALPVIDFSAFVRASSVEERQRVASRIREACIDIGFFYLSGHGIPQAELDEEIAWGHRFFEQPIEEKLRVRKPSLGERGGGFMQIGGVHPELNAEKAAALKEVYSMTREPMPGEP